jgi:Holliday junction resolvase RusA-like endonuclease
MEEIRAAIAGVLAADHPMTVRQVFYRLTSEGVIAKTEAEYKGTVCRLLGDMRRSGEIPYQWLADATRWMRRPTTYSSMEAALRRTAETYRRSLWDDAPVTVELWLEKEALAGVLVDVTDEWDVPLMVTRGYPSMSFLYSAAEAIRERSENGQRTQIYYFGDRDPSGVDIDRAIQTGIGEAVESLNRGISVTDCRSLAAGDDGISTFAQVLLGIYERESGEHAFEMLADFERVAVTEDQIAELDLPTRPTKRSDTRSKSFKGESVELDAIPPEQLRHLAAGVIERHVDRNQLAILLKAEAEERAGLESIATTLDQTGPRWVAGEMNTAEKARAVVEQLLRIAGEPAPKGSRTLGRRRDGSVFSRPASQGEAGWVEAVARSAMAARGTAQIEPPYTVELIFSLPRPARPAHAHPSRSDLDKLVRAVLDGLVRGGLLEDDRHVVRLVASKRWAAPGDEGATIRISTDLTNFAAAASRPTAAETRARRAHGRAAPAPLPSVGAVSAPDPVQSRSKEEAT